MKITDGKAGTLQWNEKKIKLKKKMKVRVFNAVHLILFIAINLPIVILLLATSLTVYSVEDIE